MKCAGWLVFSLIVFGAAGWAASAPKARESRAAAWGMRGKIVADPEKLSGLWEEPDGSGGAVGLWLRLTTTVPGAPTTLVGVPQYEQDLTFGVYRRSGPVFDSWEASYFADDPQSSVFWDGEHLRVTRRNDTSNAPAVVLRLSYHVRREVWTGYFRRGQFARSVVLRRPTRAVASGSRAGNALAGTWVSTSPQLGRCVHMVRDGSGSVEAWWDQFETPGTWRYAKGFHLPPRAATMEQYRQLLRIRQPRANVVSLDFDAYGGMCCASDWTGRLAEGGNQLDGGWISSPGTRPGPASWRKIESDSCRGFAAKLPK